MISSATAAPPRRSDTGGTQPSGWNGLLVVYRKLRDRSRGPAGAFVRRLVRQAICDEHISLVRRISRQFRFRRFEETVSGEELQSAGVLGLVKAVDNYDSRKGSAFAAYASGRIRGEMLDWLREVDPFSRDVRRMDRATTRLVRRDGRAPDDRTIAEALDTTVERVRVLQRARAAMTRTSLDDTIQRGDGSEGLRRGDLLRDASVQDPAEIIVEKETLSACRRRLSTREAKVFFEHALHGRSLREIGRELGISESRACQIRRSAREKLAQFLVGRGEVPRSWMARVS